MLYGGVVLFEPRYLFSIPAPLFGALLWGRRDVMLSCLAFRKTVLCCGALLLCLLSASCGIEKAFDAYRTALELKQQEQGISCEFESKIIFPAGEGTSSLCYSGSLLSDGQEMGNTAIAVQMAVGGSTLNMNLYYTDGMVLCKHHGSEGKAAHDGNSPG